MRSDTDLVGTVQIKPEFTIIIQSIFNDTPFHTSKFHLKRFKQPKFRPFSNLLKKEKGPCLLENTTGENSCLIGDLWHFEAELTDYDDEINSFLTVIETFCSKLHCVTQEIKFTYTPFVRLTDSACNLISYVIRNPEDFNPDHGCDDGENDPEYMRNKLFIHYVNDFETLFAPDRQEENSGSNLIRIVNEKHRRFLDDLQKIKDGNSNILRKEAR